MAISLTILQPCETLAMTLCCELSQAMSNPCTGLDRPWVFQEVEAPRFQDIWHVKVVRLSALRTARFYPPPGSSPGTHFCWRLSRPQGHSAAGRIISTKNSSDAIGNETRDLQARSEVPKPSAPQRAPMIYGCRTKIPRRRLGTLRRLVVARFVFYLGIYRKRLRYTTKPSG